MSSYDWARAAGEVTWTNKLPTHTVMQSMISKDDDRSPPERDRTANRRWMIGIAVTLVFGTFGAVMALLSYMDRDRPAATEPSVIEFLNGNTVMRWAEVTLGL